MWFYVGFIACKEPFQSLVGKPFIIILRVCVDVCYPSGMLVQTTNDTEVWLRSMSSKRSIQVVRPLACYSAIALVESEIDAAP